MSFVTVQLHVRCGITDRLPAGNFSTTGDLFESWILQDLYRTDFVQGSGARDQLVESRSQLVFDARR